MDDVTENIKKEHNDVSTLKSICDVNDSKTIRTTPGDKIIFSEPTIESIKAKYGDILKDCDFKSEAMRKVVLSGICNVLKDLYKLENEELEVGSLEKFYDALKDAEKIKINVKWLRSELDALKESVDAHIKAQELFTPLILEKKKLKRQQKELNALNIRKQNLEKDIAVTTANVDCLHKDFAVQLSEYVKSRVSAFYHLFG